MVWTFCCTGMAKGVQEFERQQIGPSRNWGQTGPVIQSLIMNHELFDLLETDQMQLAKCIKMSKLHSFGWKTTWEKPKKTLLLERDPVISRDPFPFDAWLSSSWPSGRYLPASPSDDRVERPPHCHCPEGLTNDEAHQYILFNYD